MPPADGTALRRMAKVAVGRALQWGGAVQRRRQMDALVILMLHKINDHPGPLNLTVSPANLEAAIREVKRDHDVVSLEDAVGPEGVLSSGGMRFAVTSDDGYRDNFEHLTAVVQNHGVVPTVFLSLDQLDGTRAFWYERITHALMHTRHAALDARAEGAGLHPLSTPGERVDAVLALDRHLKQFDLETGERIADTWVARLEVSDPPPTPMLTWEMVAQMAEAGVRFGSHTLSHPILSRETPERVRQEVAGSREALSRRLGRPVEGFAYPSGRSVDFNEVAVAAVRDASYRYACTTVKGFNLPGADPYRLARISIHDRMMTDGNGRFSPSLFWAKVLALM